MRRLRPFFTYFGGKHRIARKYPAPKHRRLVELFAGSAGYATAHYERSVVLVEKDPKIAGVWRYIIGASPAEILALPDVMPGETTDDLRVPQEARWLIGLWLNKGAAAPMKSPSAWMRSGTRPKSYWGPEIRARIAGQLDAVRHWQIFEASYEDAPISESTWFVDPPYERAGKHYPQRFTDFERLASVCMRLPGQVIVCEEHGAAWLPFSPFVEARASPSKRGGGVCREALWVSG